MPLLNKTAAFKFKEKVKEPKTGVESWVEKEDSGQVMSEPFMKTLGDGSQAMMILVLGTDNVGREVFFNGTKFS